MKTTVSRYDFHRAFEEIRPDNFSYQGLNAMFEYFEQYEEDCGVEIELDVIAICCDFAEYTLEELESEYSEYVDEDNRPEVIEDWVEILSDHTAVIPVDDDSLILQAF